MIILKFLVCLMSFLAEPVNAALSPVIIEDTSTSVAVYWEWGGEPSVSSEPSFSNWYSEVALNIDLSNGPSGFIGNLEIYDPTNPFALLVPLLILGDENSLGILADNEFTHLGVRYVFLFERDAIPENSNIQLSATVAPLPSALLLFLSAVPLLWVNSSRKLTARQA